MKQHTRISAISAPDRPRERLLALGPRRLRNEELLAIVIGSGTRSASSLELARTILKRTSGPAGLAQASVAALLETEGVGPAVAMRIVAGCELNRRAMRARSSGPLARAPAAGGPGSDSLRAADKRSVTGAA
jgi:DNA repair protein RadC